MQELRITSTKAKQIIDITLLIQKELNNQQATEGTITLFVMHTTAAITTADLDPGTDLDMLDAFESIMPKLQFRHLHDPSHVPDHIWSSIIGPSVTIPFQDGELLLGTWQRIVLIEFDGPRERSVIINTNKP